MRKLFHYNKNDRDAIVLLVLVIVACIVLIPLIVTNENTDATKSETNSYNKQKKSLYYAQEGTNDGSTTAESDCELFPFDPNTADSTQLLRLGLKPWQVRSIYRYRSKGGHFYKKSDFAKLYGLTLKKYRQLEPYIRIKQEVMAADVIKEEKHLKSSSQNLGTTTAPSQQNNGNNMSYAQQDNVKPSYDKAYLSNKLKYGETVDINTADTTELKRIPGIGSYFARRIVELRQRRQAFVNAEELLTIRNFPETALTYMTVSQSFPTININKATQKELERHPLINYVQARDIIKLRNTRGQITNIKELSLLPSLTPESIKRLSPFIVF